jgi:hypothetical protein
MILPLPHQKLHNDNTTIFSFCPFKIPWQFRSCVVNLLVGKNSLKRDKKKRMPRTGIEPVTFRSSV